ncbi:MAG: tRNA-dihydrouridine synthase [Parachlamydiales bacterium]|nr:tRNA-dihydrouridine synthase [Parachlamydiales bacterium]
MKTGIYPLQIQGLSLSSNIFYAPLAGYTDYPTRQMIASFRPGLFFTEMVRGKALIEHFEKVKNNIEIEENMHPVGAQFYENDISIAVDAAQFLENKGFDWVDFNCACPSPNIVRQKCGAYFLRCPQEFSKILRAIVLAVKVPVSVKIRLGWDHNSVVAPELTRIAEDVGAAAVLIHGRTALQGYRGKAQWEKIAQCVTISKNILIIGNGDIFSSQEAKERLLQSRCHGILIGRGMLGNYGICSDIQNFFLKKEEYRRSWPETLRQMRRHWGYILDYYPVISALKEMKKVGFLYLKGHKDIKKIRKSLAQANTPSAIFALYDDICKIM